MGVKQTPAKLCSSVDLANWVTEASDSNLDGLSVWSAPIDRPREFFRVEVGGAGEKVSIGVPDADPEYTESFVNGTGASLHNNLPEGSTANARWTADASFKDNGTISGTGSATAFLPFSPVNGRIYTLSTEIQQTAQNSDSWLSFGFLSGSSSTGTFANNGVIWALTRDFSGNDNQVPHENAAGGTGSVARGSFVTGASTVAMSIVLDTTGGSGNWKYDWIVNGVTKASGKRLGSAFENGIGRIGIGHFNNPSHSFLSLTLTTD